MKIGNILYKKELVNHEKVDYINYYDFADNSSIKIEDIDNSLPTLIVGWKFLKEYYPDLDVNILTHRIKKDKLYWEFSFDENKSSHIDGVQNFIENLPYFYYTPKFKYKNLDPVFYQINNNQELFDIIPKKINGFYKFKDRMLYILSNNEIYGLDLEMYNFFKFNIQGILDRLISICNGSITYDSEGKIYQKYYNLFPDFSYLKRYLVVILSK
jgi:hypothetical protein